MFHPRLNNKVGVDFMAGMSLRPPPYLPRNIHNLHRASRGLFNSQSFAYGICKNIRHLCPYKTSYRLLLNNAPRFDHSEAAVSSSNAGDVRDNFEDMDNEIDHPIFRSYENDLCKLTVTGYCSLEDAITAAAADGGITASEHIADGRPMMVIESFHPGYHGEHSTVSTKLLVPASKVLEKGNDIQKIMGSIMLPDNSSRKMLSIAFKRVIMQYIWNFELFFFTPGTCRDMDSFAAERKVQLLGSLKSSDEKVLTGLAEAVCLYAAACLEDDFQIKMLGKSSKNLFQSFQKPKWMASSDSCVRIRPLSKSEIAGHTRTGLKQPITNLEDTTDLRNGRNWWPWPSHLSSTPNNFNSESNVWSNEYIPVHKLQIAIGKFKDMKFQGGQKCTGHVWEIFLSHLQLVDLANVLDMYYEDPNTCPGKQLQAKIVLEPRRLVMSKITLSLWKALYTSLVGGIALVSVIIAARLWKPNSWKPGFCASNSMILSSTDQKLEEFSAQKSKKSVLPLNEEISVEEMETMCTLVVQMVKNALQWPENIQSYSGKGAWIGPSLTEWARLDYESPITAATQDAPDSSNKEIENMNKSEEQGLKHANASKGDAASQNHGQGNLQKPNEDDIAIYEVTLSRNGTLLGFQPKTNAAVNEWASHPLTKVLYDGQQLRPGLLEPRLKFSGPPTDAVIIELLMSKDPNYRLITARPLTPRSLAM